MALQGSGTIKLSEIQTEFTGSNPISLSEYYRDGGYVTSNNTNVPTSGAIRLGQFYNAVRQFAFTISSSYTTTQDLRTLALAAGWDGAAPVVATVNSGVVLQGVPGPENTGSGTNALTISGSFPAGVSLINNGTIVGGGGGGGFAPRGGTGQPGGVGGVGIFVSTNVSITNNNIIGGGGGGGGGGGSYGSGGIVYFPGSGGGGAPYGVGGSGDGLYGPGQTATFTAGGASGPYDFGRGGTGGTYGVNGEAGQSQTTPGGAGGVAGAAVSGNSYVTWVATGTRYGALV